MRRSSLSKVSRPSHIGSVCILNLLYVHSLTSHFFCLYLCYSAAGASSSSSDNNLSTPSTTSDLSRTFSNDSTMLFHPDGERSPSTSDVAASLNLPSLQKDGDLSSVAGVSISVASSTTSSSLPRPGDPGAPPLPDEVMVESPSNIDAATPGCNSSGGDPNFQPLRSRSLTPTLHRSIF